MHENTSLLQPEILRADDEFIIARGRTGAEQASVLTVTTATRDPSRRRSRNCSTPMRCATTRERVAVRLWHLRKRRRGSRSCWRIRGPALDQLCSRPLRWESSCEWRRARRGARRLHQKGLIHKDIKPANCGCILVRAGLVDGLRLHLADDARARDRPAPPNFLAGTLAYMGPSKQGG